MLMEFFLNFDHFLLVSISNRSVDYERCSFKALQSRYADRGRLDNIPKFSELSSLHDGHASYKGSLNIYHLTGRVDNIRLEFVKKIIGDGKIQHGIISGETLILCYEDRLEFVSNWMDKNATTETMNDNWFAGLHTVFENKLGDFIVSSSAADAVIVVDGCKKIAKTRFRLPSCIYGENYDLTAADNLKDHYVHNDLQLGHLNSAFPDEYGNIWVTTLIQGDVGCFRSDGSFDKILSGYIGAHGVRRLENEDIIYFSDSCNGGLVLADIKGGLKQVYRSSSLWMHDAQYLGEKVYLLGAPDLGKIIAVDLEAGRTQEFSVPEDDGCIQFMSVTSVN